MIRTLISIVCMLVLVGHQASADIRHEIADRLGIERGSFVLNLPPRPGCLPGSIFTEDLRIPIKRTAREDAGLDRGPIFEFAADLTFDAGAEAGVGFAQWFGVAAKAKHAAAARIEFKEARVVEILGAELKRRVLADPDARAAAERRVPPFVVSRAFEGRVVVRLTRKSGASADAWAKLKAEAVEAKVGASIDTGDDIVITVAEPFVFAFEVMRLNYVTTHLGTTAGDDVRLAPVPEDLFQR